MSQKPNRKTTFLGMLLILMLLLTSCAQPTQAPAAQTEAPAAEEPAAPAAQSGPVELSMWTEFTTGGEATGIDAIIAAFNEKNPDIKVTHRPIGNEEFFTVVRTGLAGGEPPDILQFEGYQQTRDFAAAGQLLDVTDLWNASKERFDLADAGEYSCTYEGKVYCIPFSFITGWQIYYNPTILEENGIAVPQTMEEFLAAAEKLKAAGITPIALGNKDGWPGEHWWMALLVQRCGVDTIYSAIQKQGAKFTDECFVQATNDYKNLADSGYFSAGAASDDYGTAQAVFLSGKSAFFQTGAWFASGWESQPPPFEVGIMPFPRFSDSEFDQEIIGAITHTVGVPSASKHTAEAMKFLEFLTTEEAGQIWAKNGNASVIAGAVDAAAPQVVKDLYNNAKSASNSLPWIENELPPGVGEDKVYNGTVALLTGDMTAEQYLQSIQDALDAAE